MKNQEPHKMKNSNFLDACQNALDLCDYHTK